MACSLLTRRVSSSDNSKYLKGYFISNYTGVYKRVSQRAMGPQGDSIPGPNLGWQVLAVNDQISLVYQADLVVIDLFLPFISKQQGSKQM